MHSSITSQEDRIDVAFNLFTRSCQLNDGLPNVCPFACALHNSRHRSVKTAYLQALGP
jgi:hypothetical protein